jgi:hypothetical protein
MKKYSIKLVVTIQIAGTNCNKDKLQEKLPGEKNA